MYNTVLEEKIDDAVKRWQNVEKKKIFSLRWLPAQGQHVRAVTAGE